MDDDTAKRIQTDGIAAIQKGDADLFQRILRDHPDFPPSTGYWLPPIHSTAFLAGLPYFKILVECFPHIKTWDLGHLGNPIGLTAAQGKVDFLKFLLDDLGLVANQGRVQYDPILYFVSCMDESIFPHKADVMRLLEQHGATLQGEGACSQKSHILANGAVCWHRGGKAKPPNCLETL